jgi:hypothetical protein
MVLCKGHVLFSTEMRCKTLNYEMRVLQEVTTSRVWVISGIVPALCANI